MELTREQALEKWGWDEIRWDEKKWGPLVEEKSKSSETTKKQFKPASKEQIEEWVSFFKNLKESNQIIFLESLGKKIDKK